MINFAILGAGMIAEYHQQAIEANADKGARLVAISHYNPDRFDAITQQFGVPCQSYEDVLARDDVDAICICTPSGQHAEQTIAAARAGKHVLVEKPMALSLPDADAMIAACKEAGVTLGVVFQRRVEPIFQRVYDAIHGGDLGDLTLGVVTMPYSRDAAYYAQAEWRGTWALDGGGVLMNQGIHIIDLLVWLMGDPVSIEAHGGTLHRPVEVEDVAAAALRFENGSVATISATTTASPGFPHRLEIYGTNGGIQIEGEGIVAWTLADESLGTVEPFVSAEKASAGAGADPRGIAATGHIAIVGELLDAIAEGRTPSIDGEQGKRSLAVILGIYEDAGLI